MNAIAALRATWRAAIGLLALAIIAGGLLPLPEVATAGQLDKAGHFLAYFALALAGSGIVTPDRLWVVMARSFALGLGVELLQSLAGTGRSADWLDVVANGAGVLAAWAIAGSGRAGWSRHIEAWLARRARS